MSLKRFFIMLLLGCSPVWSSVRAEQTCDTKSFAMSASLERFSDNGDGTLFDLEPDLTWMRCSLGQIWNGSTCTGTPATYTWEAAKAEACKLNEQGGFAGHSDWRVPKIAELASIAERQCTNPRIDLALFPATPPVYFWTVTMRPGSVPDDPYAYAISFGADGPRHAGKGEKFSVRLVRGGVAMDNPIQ